MIDYKRIEEQEKLDFQITKNIFENILKKENIEIVNIKQTEMFNHCDCIITIKTKKGNLFNYRVEIKTRNSIEDIKTLPLKVNKYLYIKNEESIDSQCLIIYLVNNNNNNEYFIFNLSTLEITQKDLSLWHIQKTQYIKGKPQFETTPMINLDVAKAVYHGSFNIENNNNLIH